MGKIVKHTVYQLYILHCHCVLLYDLLLVKGVILVMIVGHNYKSIYIISSKTSVQRTLDRWFIIMRRYPLIPLVFNTPVSFLVIPETYTELTKTLGKNIYAYFNPYPLK